MTEHDKDDAPGSDLSALVIGLLKGVLYQESDANLWHALIQLQAHVRDYVSVLGLELMLDEAEGYAFLRSMPERDDAPASRLPRLVVRRPLSFPVNLSKCVPSTSAWPIGSALTFSCACSPITSSGTCARRGGS